MAATYEKLSDEILIDTEGFAIYGHDQANTDFPIVYPTVTFDLEPTSALLELADKVREKKGYDPLFSGEDFDENGYYDVFQLGLNGMSRTHVDSSIIFMVVDHDAADDGETYQISLSESEQEDIYNALDAQCKQIYGMTCEELLREAQKVQACEGQLTILPRIQTGGETSESNKTKRDGGPL